MQALVTLGTDDGLGSLIGRRLPSLARYAKTMRGLLWVFIHTPLPTWREAWESPPLLPERGRDANYATSAEFRIRSFQIHDTFRGTPPSLRSFASVNLTLLNHETARTLTRRELGGQARSFLNPFLGIPPSSRSLASVKLTLLSKVRIDGGREYLVRAVIFDKLYRTYVEVIDPRSARVVTTHKIDGYVMEALPDRRVALYRVDENGIPRVQIAALTLSGR
jgi:hypothetical protein